MRFPERMGVLAVAAARVTHVDTGMSRNPIAAFGGDVVSGAFVRVSTRSPLNPRKSVLFAVTSTRSLTQAIAAIWPSKHRAVFPAASSFARSRARHSAALRW